MVMADDSDKKRAALAQMLPPQAGEMKQNQQVVIPAKQVQPQPVEAIRGIIAAKVEREDTLSKQLMDQAMSIFTSKPGVTRELISRGYEMRSLLENPEVFNGSKVKFSKNEEKDIAVYSVEVTLNGRPRILTLEVGSNFMQLSLYDSSSRKVLESIREDTLPDKTGRITFGER